MRMFDATILIIDSKVSARVDERIDAIDFHDACTAALGAALMAKGRLLAIVEVTPLPKLVS
jgi:hypothetical protein